MLAMAMVLAAGCATPRVAGECPETAGVRCLSKRVCTYDRDRGCERCSCDAPWNPARESDEQRRRGGTP
jgi:hypothetical protein